MRTEEEQIRDLRNKYLEMQDKKGEVKFPSLYRLRFPVAWTLFFVIVGIIQQSIVAKKIIFIDFFSSNYMAWFNTFGDFANRYGVVSLNDLLLRMLSFWYYFFFTGGLLSILWALLYIITHIQRKPRGDFI